MYPPSRWQLRRSSRFPRTRGDVPRPDADHGGRQALPPHARGCTAGTAGAGPPAPASPARAGMYPNRTIAAAHISGFPRTRGDVPRGDPPEDGRAELPPHARGCTFRGSEGARHDEASPARAGMYRVSGRRPAGEVGFPRTRGDVPQTRLTALPQRSLPPHARGCTLLQGQDFHHGIASPARAGMYLRRRSHGALVQGFPRTRGDVPPIHGAAKRGRGLPPHARGCTAGSGASAQPR